MKIIVHDMTFFLLKFAQSHPTAQRYPSFETVIQKWQPRSMEFFKVRQSSNSSFYTKWSTIPILIVVMSMLDMQSSVSISPFNPNLSQVLNITPAQFQQHLLKAKLLNIILIYTVSKTINKSTYFFGKKRMKFSQNHI